MNHFEVYDKIMPTNVQAKYATSMSQKNQGNINWNARRNNNVRLVHNISMQPLIALVKARKGKR